MFVFLATRELFLTVNFCRFTVLQDVAIKELANHVAIYVYKLYLYPCYCFVEY